MWRNWLLLIAVLLNLLSRRLSGGMSQTVKRWCDAFEVFHRITGRLFVYHGLIVILHILMSRQTLHVLEQCLVLHHYQTLHSFTWKPVFSFISSKFSNSLSSSVIKTILPLSYKKLYLFSWDGVRDFVWQLWHSGC
jgi:hypothetical protein